MLALLADWAAQQARYPVKPRGPLLAYEGALAINPRIVFLVDEASSITQSHEPLFTRRAEMPASLGKRLSKGRGPILRLFANAQTA